MIARIKIAIDGHSSCGKSTLAKDLARQLNYLYMDSGAMYRAVSLYCIENGIDASTSDNVIAALADIKLTVSHENHQFRIYLNEKDVTSRIIESDVSSIVSPVAAIPEVRKKLVKIQQRVGDNADVVMDGRDIGTVVFPTAELKLFVTADPDVRAERRYKELIAKGMEADQASVKENLLSRDHIDSTRADSPLIQADDAILIDNTYMNREEQLLLVMKLAQEVIEKKKGTA